MLRLLGALTLGHMVFGHHRRWHHRHCLGRGLLIGTILGLFISRANQSRADGYEGVNENV